MSCCRAGCAQTAGKQGLKPPQSSPGSVLGGMGAHTPVQGHVCGAKPSQWSCGSCVYSSAGVRAANDRYAVGKLHGHVFILPPMAFPATPLLGSCSGSASVTLTP